jgi:hypothetical protein
MENKPCRQHPSPGVFCVLGISERRKRLILLYNDLPALFAILSSLHLLLFLLFFFFFFFYVYIIKKEKKKKSKVERKEGENDFLGQL